MEYVGREVPTSVYTLADALGFPITMRPSRTLIMTDIRKMNFDGLEFTVGVQIVSSCVMAATAAMLVRTTGNLGLLLVAGYEKSATVSLFVVDFALMGTPEGIMEKERLTNPCGAVGLMKEAIVVRYDRVSPKRWTRVSVGD